MTMELQGWDSTFSRHCHRHVIFSELAVSLTVLEDYGAIGWSRVVVVVDVDVDDDGDGDGDGDDDDDDE